VGDEYRGWSRGGAEGVIDVALEEIELDGQIGGQDVLVSEER
jgi:hypothetical protein